MTPEFEEIMRKVQAWAKDKGLDKADLHILTVKLMEEVGELSKDVKMVKLIDEIGEPAEDLVKYVREEIFNAMGDILVVLTIFGLQLDIKNIIECYFSAYKKIKNSNGKMVNGVFIKEDDLQKRGDINEQN